MSASNKHTTMFQMRRAKTKLKNDKDYAMALQKSNDSENSSNSSNCSRSSSNEI